MECVGARRGLGQLWHQDDHLSDVTPLTSRWLTPSLPASYSALLIVTCYFSRYLTDSRMYYFPGKTPHPPARNDLSWLFEPVLTFNPGL